MTRRIQKLVTDETDARYG